MYEAQLLMKLMVTCHDSDESGKPLSKNHMGEGYAPSKKDGLSFGR